MDWIIIGGLLIIIVTQILLRPKQLNNNKEDLEKLLNEIQRSFDRIEKNFREDFRLNREESRLVAKDNREELARSMNEFKEAFERGIDSFNRLQKEKFAALDEHQQRLVDNTEKRLEEIRVTVDEKLQKTLNDRIGQSFRLVSEQLESVQKGLGEMQTLAQDVGGLKRVLSNVKTRGNIGEIQLSMLLEQLLAPEQYEANVHTRKGSDAVVPKRSRQPENYWRQRSRRWLKIFRTNIWHLPPRPISALCSCRSRAFTPRSYAVPLYWRTCNETTR